MSAAGAEARFRLRLVAEEAPAGEPAGLVLSLPAAMALLLRLRPRLARHATLRLALAGGDAILFAAEPAPLPWTEAARLYLGAEDALLLPYGRRLDAPPRWRAEIVRRLLDRHGLAGPALLLPERDALRLVDLAPSRPLAQVDLARLRTLAG